MRKITPLVLIAMSIVSRAETLPSPGLLDARIRAAPYSADQVYVLKGFVGYQTDLEFETGETFVGLGAGDIDGLSFVAEENHLFLKPKAAKPVTYVLRFTYPPSPKASGETSDRALAAESKRVRNIDYWYCGEPSLQPIAASDDGVHTRLTFAAKAEQPAIFVLNEDGSESLLNFSMDEGDVIVHRVARRLILRRGQLAGCVVNKGFAGSGERLKSHTVSEEVERLTPGARP